MGEGGHPKAVKSGGVCTSISEEKLQGPGPLTVNPERRWAVSAEDWRPGLHWPCDWSPSQICFSVDNHTACGVLWWLLQAIETLHTRGKAKEKCSWNGHKTQKGSWASGELLLGLERSQGCLSSLGVFLSFPQTGFLSAVRMHGLRQL